MGCLKLKYHPNPQQVKAKLLFNLEATSKNGGRAEKVLDYYSFGSIMPGRSYQGSEEYRYGFNGMEKDDEIKGNGNSYDFGARIYDARVGRWLSVDPMAGRYPSFTPFGFAANNPIFYLDPNGKWVVRFNSDNTGIEFVAEKGDNLATLSIQLGIDANMLIELYPDFENKVWTDGDVEQLMKLEVVQAINSYIELKGTNSAENCAMAAAEVSGVELKLPREDWRAAFNDAVDQFSDYLQEHGEDIPLADSKIGDVIVYGANYEALVKEYRELIKQLPENETPESYAKEMQYYQDSDNPSHFSIVLLKSKDGKSVQQVFEKDGAGSVQVSGNPSENKKYTPNGKTIGQTNPVSR